VDSGDLVIEIAVSSDDPQPDSVRHGTILENAVQQPDARPPPLSSGHPQRCAAPRPLADAQPPPPPPLPRGGIAEPAARFYAACALLALEWMHGRRMVHRDVKPDNMLLFSCGYLKLSDLGACCIVPAGHAPTTRTGTPAYMAPEGAGKGRQSRVARSVLFSSRRLAGGLEWVAAVPVRPAWIKALFADAKRQVAAGAGWKKRMQSGRQTHNPTTLGPPALAVNPRSQGGAATVWRGRPLEPWGHALGAGCGAAARLGGGRGRPQRARLPAALLTGACGRCGPMLGMQPLASPCGPPSCGRPTRGAPRRAARAPRLAVGRPPLGRGRTLLVDGPLES
jgi:hypothetical protein